MPKTLCTSSRMVLDLLRANSRATVCEMAARVGISRTTIAYHLDQLVERGDVRRFTSETDPERDRQPPRPAGDVRHQAEQDTVRRRIQHACALAGGSVRLVPVGQC
ncbi:MAG: Lrp/AsnC family transcriptional regulator [Rhodobacteraceae bacterium]|nr:MAG: Lrp/AsnC family transcriptional regulator [Paracoccaceae bacterium]